MKANTQTKIALFIAILVAIAIALWLITRAKPTLATGDIQLDFWSLMVPGDDATNAFIRSTQNTLVAEFPQLNINFVSMDGDEYKPKIKAALAANELPDIFYTWLPGYATDFINSNAVMKLDNHLSTNAKTHLNMNAINSGNGAFDGIYALPVEVKMGILYCNREMFEQYGIQMPDSYEQLLTAIDQFNQQGIQPILAPGKRTWPIMWLYDILAVKSIGTDATISSLKKESSFNQPEFKMAAAKLQALVARNAFGQDALLLDNNEANERFFQGLSPMYYMGSWIATTATDKKSAIAGKVTAKRFPGLGNEFDKHMLGGTGDGFMIANASDHKTEALQVLERYIQLMGESDAVLFPVWKNQKDFSDKDPLYTDLSNLYQQAEGFVIWWDTYMASNDAAVHKDLTIQLFAQRISPELFIEQMQGISSNE